MADGAAHALPADALVHRRFWLLAALLVGALSSCKSARDREADRVHASLSWVATAGSVTRAWADNRVPVRYVERTLDEARAALAQNGESTAVRITTSLRDAVHRRDRAALAGPLAQLGQQWSALEARSEQLEKGQ